MSMSSLIYPLLCGLSLAALPLQPEEEVLTMAGELPALTVNEEADSATAAAAAAAETERIGRLSIRQANRVLA